MKHVTLAVQQIAFCLYFTRYRGAVPPEQEAKRKRLTISFKLLKIFTWHFLLVWYLGFDKGYIELFNLDDWLNTSETRLYILQQIQEIFSNTQAAKSPGAQRCISKYSALVWTRTEDQLME